MSGQAAVQTQTTTRPAITPAAKGMLQRQCACGQHTAAGGECEACKKKRDGTLQRAAISPSPVHEVPSIVHEVLRSPGQPLDGTTRAFMEPHFDQNFGRVQARSAPFASIQTHPMVNVSQDRFEQEADRKADAVMRGPQPRRSMLPMSDFSHVRVHNDTQAHEAARVVNAEAFTVGSHVVFAAGRYAPATNRGQYLLAHELTHCVQQQATPSLQRKLAVDPNPPSNAPPGDPAIALSPAVRFSMMDTLIQGLCDRFEVDPASGEVQPKSLQSLDPAVLAAGSKPTGCCCLNVLTSAPTQWMIEVSGIIGAQTDFAGHQVFLNPTSTPLEFGAFTSAGSLAFQGAIPTAGHELCGHAALQELSAHPSTQDRLTTDVHDPTVRIENLVSSEQGVPAGQLRGLAASGTHRGESVDKITIQNYPLNGTDVPAGEQSKLQLAVAYINENEEFLGVLGHSDNVGSQQAKQAVSTQRAEKVRQALIARGVLPTITKHGLTNAARFTRVEGLSDTQPPPPPLNANQSNWRRVEILMAGFPAGAQNPPSGTPTAVTPHVQSPNVPGLKVAPDPCVRHLVGGAYP
jgi:outer membrane protein OmpA-like peptidoglycan-associated protein